MRQRFITLEGGEGAGKSTQAVRIQAFLERHGHKSLITREPGGSPGAEQIRGLLVSGEVGRWDAMTEALLLYAARHDHLTRAILPALEAGSWVICDRFSDSTMAYQGYGQANGADIRPTLDMLEALIVKDNGPSRTYILDLPPDVGLARAKQRDAARQPGHTDRFERMDIGFHTRLREGFLAIAQAHADRCFIVDATGDADAVYAQIEKDLRSFL